VVAVAYLVASVYIVPSFVASIVSRPFHRFERRDIPRGRVALVIFGGGNENVTGWDGQIAVPSAVTASRVLEARRVYNLAAPEWVISSGGNASPEDEAEPSSVSMKKMLEQLGVPPARIVLESTSRDSHDEAVLIRPMLGTLGADAAILVTSAVHMRRSLGACRAAGWEPVPAVAPDPWYQHDWADWFVPSNHALYFSGEVAHELVGIPYYRLRGWSR
jgi:uncharacterized SAM-binding protein YcdF (DUF218 family)